MPLLNNGIIPGGAPGTEFQNTVRRIFIPQLFVLLGQACPTLAMLLRSARVARGGVSPVTVSLQTTGMVTGAWTGYLGNFAAPQPIPGINANAEFNQNMFVIPIPFLFTERAITERAKIVDILAARMSDARRYFADQMGNNVLFTLNNGTSPLQPSGFLDMFDDGSNAATYGNVSRTTYPNFRGGLKTSAGAILTRKAFNAAIIQTGTKQLGNATTANGGPGGTGEAPNIVIMSPGDWVTLEQDFQQIEQIFLTPGSQFGTGSKINTGFRALTVGNTRIFFDQYCPTGTAFIFDSRMVALFLNELAPFAFTGWESTVPVNQLGWVGALVVLLSLVCAVPRTGAQFTGITGAAF